MTKTITPFAQPLPTLGMPSAAFTEASNGFMMHFPTVIKEMNEQIEEYNALNAWGPASFEDLQPGDVPVYSGSTWVNDPKQHLTDGGNF